MIEEFARRRLDPEAHVYRVLDYERWIDKSKSRAKARAFYLRPKDTDGGLSVMPELRHCLSLNFVAIAKLKVGDIEAISNPFNGRSLLVIQDRVDHAMIENLTFSSLNLEAAETLGEELALASLIVSVQEIEEARSAALTTTKPDATDPEHHEE